MLLYWFFLAIYFDLSEGLAPQEIYSKEVFALKESQ
jgi:hypothetical protein